MFFVRYIVGYLAIVLLASCCSDGQSSDPTDATSATGPMTHRFPCIIDVDAPQASDWPQLRKDAEAGVGRAAERVATHYLKQPTTHGNIAEATRWLTIASRFNPDPFYAKSLLFRYGLGVVQNDGVADHWRSWAMLCGDVSAEMDTLVNEAYKSGAWTDSPLTTKWIQNAAESGDARAITLLGLLAEDGRLGRANPHEAKRHYSRASELGFTPAMLLVARLYDHGIGVTQDRHKAMDWKRKAADLGDTEAMFRIGLLHTTPVFGFFNDGTETLGWLQKAAERGHPMAMTKLGEWYATELPWSMLTRTKGLHLLNEAARRGCVHALEVLGEIYSGEVFGNRTAHPADHVRSRALCYAAQALGENELARIIDWIEPKMTASELQDARVLANEILQSIRASRSR